MASDGYPLPCASIVAGGTSPQRGGTHFQLRVPVPVAHMVTCPQGCRSSCPAVGLERVSILAPKGALRRSDGPALLVPGRYLFLFRSSCQREENDFQRPANLCTIHDQNGPHPAQGVLWLHLLHHVGQPPAPLHRT